jgi:hypothetical protein
VFHAATRIGMVFLVEEEIVCPAEIRVVPWIVFQEVAGNVRDLKCRRK